MLAVGQERVCHVCDLVVSPVHNVPVLVSHKVLIFPIINLEFVLEGEKSIWNEIQDITSGMGFV